MSESLSKKNQEEIKQLQTSYAVMNVKIDNITQSIHEIKNNHLLHINDELLKLNDSLVSNHTNITELVTNKISEIYSKISELKIADARTEPGSKLFNKIIEYVILGLVGIAIAFIASH